MKNDDRAFEERTKQISKEVGEMADGMFDCIFLSP